MTTGKGRRGKGGATCGTSAPTKTLQDVLRQRPGWLEGQDEEWDFHWCDVGWLRETIRPRLPGGPRAHLPLRNHYELTRKNLMVKNLKRQRRHLEREASPAEAARCDFFPCTLELPCEYHLFVEEFKRSPGGTWIMKPARRRAAASSCSARLKDVTDWRRERGRADEPRDEAAPVESYAWLYATASPASPGTRFAGSIRDQYAHLTNVAVQCTAPDYDPSAAASGSCSSCAVPDGAPRRRAVEALFGEIDNVFVRSLQSVQKGLKPWLIEVNASPSLNATCQQDYELKCRLLEDTLNVVDMEGRVDGTRGAGGRVRPHVERRARVPRGT
ncbi:hypothetical protein AAFF_G00291000 [Aldrovandia affinis]|uniref:Tubulin--tyrosine ligase-like protein 9 n=1 Tax=Aldrovandia affinis TaxID=143900 RepID=A0AAD7W1L0_9TELE|nr:hypothetical protein AAFF_G00291000 [Aldrovandia affinis]